MAYTLKGENIFEDDKDKGSLIDFLDNEYDVVENGLYSLLNKSEIYGRKEKKKVEDQIEELVIDHFKSFFKKNTEVDEDMLEDEVDKIIENLDGHGKGLKNMNDDYIQKLLKNKHTDKKISNDNNTAGGNEMFKNMKEAKLFTAHLDSLASEIESLADVSPEMRKHLAVRLDKLSDLIEKSAGSAEKLFVVETVEGDSDENSYMKEFNTDNFKEVEKVAGAIEYDKNEPYLKNVGDGNVIESDSDEKYMNNFNDDNHSQVIERKTPKADDGKDMDALAIYVKKAMEKLK